MPRMAEAVASASSEKHHEAQSYLLASRSAAASSRYRDARNQSMRRTTTKCAGRGRCTCQLSLQNSRNQLCLATMFARLAIVGRETTSLDCTGNQLGGVEGGLPKLLDVATDVLASTRRSRRHDRATTKLNFDYRTLPE